MISVAVIGAGASGLTAALCAARRGAGVTVFERNKAVGKKLSMTGNGRCNLTHFPVEPEKYTGTISDRVQDLLYEGYGPVEVVSLFDSIGMTTTNVDGYVYPMSFEAKTVSEFLKAAAEKEGVEFRTDECVRDVRPADGGFSVITEQGDGRYDRVVMATGGLARPDTGSDGLGYELIRRLGIKVSPVMPALCPLKCSDRDLKALAGVRAKGRVKLICKVERGTAPFDALSDGTAISEGSAGIIASETGEVQFTADALSGICVFNLTPYAALLLRDNISLTLSVDLAPDKELSEVEQIVGRLFEKSPYADPKDVLRGMMNRKLAAVVAARGGARKERLSSVIKDMRFNVASCYGFDRSQSSVGGVLASEVDDSLMSVRHRGLYFTGETLDICGPCGGYNLQWAWMSGMIAGNAVSVSV